MSRHVAENTNPCPLSPERSPLIPQRTGTPLGPSWSYPCWLVSSASWSASWPSSTTLPSTGLTRRLQPGSCSSSPASHSLITTRRSRSLCLCRTETGNCWKSVAQASSCCWPWPSTRGWRSTTTGNAMAAGDSPGPTLWAGWQWCSPFSQVQALTCLYTHEYISLVLIERSF